MGKAANFAAFPLYASSIPILGIDFLTLRNNVSGVT